MTGNDDITTIVVTAESSLLALTRVLSVLRARQCTMTALAVARAESPEFQRLWISLKGSKPSAARVVAWVRKVEEVRSVWISSVAAHAREWLMVTMETSALTSPAVAEALAVGSCRVISQRGSYAVLEAVASTEEIGAMLATLPQQSVLAVCRVGPVLPDCYDEDHLTPGHRTSQTDAGFAAR